MTGFRKLSLARQFQLVSLAVLLGGMAIIGFWIQERIKTAVLNRTAAVTALYVDSFVSPYMQGQNVTTPLPPERVEAINRLLKRTALGQQIVAFKIWSPNGTILYSPNPSLIGQKFEVEEDLLRALSGEVNTHLSYLSEPENVYESQQWDSLIEIYAPVRVDGTGGIIAVSEFYQTPDALMSEIRSAQLHSWVVVGVATLSMYIILNGIVGRASSLIERQRRELEQNLVHLRQSLAHNRQLQARIQRAAARTTALNERYLHRISADLHDGPAQHIALALLRLQALAEACPEPVLASGNGSTTDADEFAVIESALDTSLTDLRAIAAGLRLPEVAPLSPEQTARRAVKDYRRLTGKEASIETIDLPLIASLSVKITLYRILQEALHNGYKHANGGRQHAVVHRKDRGIHIEVSDEGPGFEPEAEILDNHLGLAGMRERVEILGGTFSIKSDPSYGTTVTAILPLEEPRGPDD